MGIYTWRAGWGVGMEHEWGQGMSKPRNSYLEIMAPPALGLGPDAHKPMLLPMLHQKTDVI